MEKLDLTRATGNQHLSVNEVNLAEISFRHHLILVSALLNISVLDLQIYTFLDNAVLRPPVRYRDREALPLAIKAEDHLVQLVVKTPERKVLGAAGEG